MGYFRHMTPHARKAGVTTALCSLMAFGGLPTAFPSLAQYGLAAPAQADSTPTEKMVDIDVVDANMAAVVNMLTRQTGNQIIIQDSGQAFGRVSAYLPHVSFEKALRSIAMSANATVTRNEDGIYVIRAAGSPVVPTASPSALPAAPVAQPYYGGQTASPASPVAAPPAAPRPANLSWRKLALQHAVPSDLLKIMHWDQDLRILDPYSGTTSQRLQNTTTNSPGFILAPMPGPDGTPSVPIGRGGDGTSDQANRSVDPGAQANQFQGGFGQGGFGRGGQGGFGQGGFGQGGFGQGGFGQGNPFQGGQGNPFQGGGQNGQNGGGALPEGVERIYALQGDNSLFIEATPDGFARVRDIVKALDVAARQVQIKVEFVTASITDVDAFGINFDLAPYPGVEVSNNQGSQANLSSSSVPQTFIQVAAGNIVAQMFNSLVQGRGKVVQAPLITTTNNVQANITVSQQIPYVTTTNVTSNNGNFSNNQQQFLNLQTGLTVTPRINSDNSVTLTLQPQITDISGSPSVAGGPPPTVTQSLQTLRTVQSGETMVLGGLVRKSDTTSQSRIPFLSQLPFIGQLFRNHVKNLTDSELLIFVTPTVIDENTESQASSAGPNVTVAP